MQYRIYVKPLILTNNYSHSIVPLAALAALSAAEAAAIASGVGLGLGLAMGRNKGRSEIYSAGSISVLQEMKEDSAS